MISKLYFDFFKTPQVIYLRIPTILEILRSPIMSLPPPPKHLQGLDLLVFVHKSFLRQKTE